MRSNSNSTSRFDPLKVLPQEVWTSIIIEAASESRDDAQTIISQDILLDLLDVSSHWEVMLSSNSVLWTDIIVDNAHDVAAKVTVGLHYSKMAPLSLYIDYLSGWVTAIREAILPNKSRIVKLYLESFN